MCLKSEATNLNRTLEKEWLKNYQLGTNKGKTKYMRISTMMNKVYRRCKRRGAKL